MHHLMSDLVEKVTSTTEMSESFWDSYEMAPISLLVCDGVLKGMLSARICSLKDTYIQKPFPLGIYLCKPHSSL